jgi:hypothetical protein
MRGMFTVLLGLRDHSRQAMTRVELPRIGQIIPAQATLHPEPTPTLRGSGCLLCRRA